MKKLFLVLGSAAAVSMSWHLIAIGADFGLGRAAGVSGLASNQISQAGSIPAVAGNIISVALALVGIFFFVLVLYSGIIWMTAGGASDRVESAKKKMTAAAIGLVIVLSAYTIANFVFSNFINQPGGTATSTSSNTSEQTNTCETKAGYFCSVQSDCEGAMNGKSSGQNGCPSGEICCNNCNALGGNCIDTTIYDCNGDLRSGFCHGAYQDNKYKCCIGNSTAR